MGTFNPDIVDRIYFRRILQNYWPPFMGNVISIEQFYKRNLKTIFGRVLWKDLFVPRQAVLVVSMYKNDEDKNVWCLVGWMSVWFGIISRYLRNFRVPYGVPKWVLKYFDLEAVRNISDRKYDTFEELVMNVRLHGISCHVISPFRSPII